VLGIVALAALLWRVRPVPAPVSAGLAPWDSAAKRSEVELRLHARERQSSNPFCEHAPCEVKHQVLGEYDLPYKSHPLKLIVTASNDVQNTCHACAPTVSFFEFTGSPQDWKLEKSQFAITDWGQFGEPYTQGIIVQPLGEDTFGMFLSGGSTHQGYTEEFTQILTPIKGEWMRVADIQTFEDSSGSLTPGASDWRASIAIDDKGLPPRDLLVTTTGVRDGEKVNKTERYKFNGTEYAQVN
jgi:hypothetical protein